MLKNCRTCHSLFTSSKYDICPSCVEAEKQLVVEIKTYIKKHRQATTLEIARDVGVDVTTLLAMVRDGRLKMMG
ncbi:hypothetical protein [Alicyclobacillus dauci]|uniref:Flagellar operon protein TIGR03826 n=1 Tax=Alicyclobacillus dauci TaxID=1475485 RepID=A0ABY6Z7F4_9BACL|nr:hypothetical protein [Alicyclobacillus dauci]WAH38680.1 hypothetical protein NZD86_09450 [Alicyclobacillus dauci]